MGLKEGIGSARVIGGPNWSQKVDRGVDGHWSFVLGSIVKVLLTFKVTDRNLFHIDFGHSTRSTQTVATA